MTPSHSSGNGNRAAREPFSLRTNHPSTLHLSPRRRKFKHDAENLPPHPANGVHTNFSFKPSYDSSENAPSWSPFSNKNTKNRAGFTRSNPVDSVEALDGSREEFCASKRRLDWERQGERTTSELSSIPMQESAMDTGVKVFVRLRPLNHKESQDEATHVVEMTSGNSLCLADQNFTFDAVLGPEASQETVFQAVGLPLVENCLAGFNSSIFAYGQTGSGKTHTMWGAVNEPIAGQALSEDCGLTPRVFERLFKRMEEEEHNNANKGLHYQCQCSFLEIYNEQITDLLDMTQKSLQIREDLHTGVYVENLTVEPITGIDDVTQLLLRGLANRRIGATSMNAESSRSHSVFTCVIESRFRNLADGTKSMRTSRINLVDLAGSERQKLTGASGERLKEAGNINRSLSQLGNLISILAEMSQTGKQRHIPYRDSRLTFLLQESLGGNAKLVMICAISPASSCRNETLSTLRFAQRAKSITNKAVVNEETESDVKFLREQVRQLKEELIRIKSDQSQCKGVASCSTDLKSAMRDRNLCATSLKQTLISASLNFNENQEEIDNAIPESIDPRTLQTSDGAMTMFESNGFGCEGKDTFPCGHADTDRELATFESSGESALESGNFIADNGQVPTPKDERGRPAILLNHSVDNLLEEVVGETSALLLNHSVDDSSCAKEQEDREIELQGCNDTDFLKEIRASPSQNSHNCDISTEKEEPSLSKLECDKFSNDVTSSKSLNHILVNFDDNMSNICVPLPHLKADLASHASVNDLHILNTEDCTQIESECGVQTFEVSNPFPHSSCLLLASPTLTESPPMKAYKQEDDMFLPVLPDASFGNWPTDLEKRMEPSSISSVQSSKIAFTNSVASTLQLGIQLHESQKNNLDVENSSIQFSFQTADIKERLPVDMAVERSPGWIETAANFPDPANSNDPIGPSSDKLQCQLLMSAESTMSVPVCDNTTQAFEKLQPILAAAIHREGTLEEALKTAKEDIKQLDSLVCQYKNERQCNVFLHQIQESRISRLQNLIHGVIDKSLFMNEELESIATEKKLLQEIIDQHPEVAHANLERRRTCEKLDRYRHFFDLGERDILLKDVSELRDCVLSYMDVDSVKSVTQSSSSLIAKTSLVLSSVSENAWLFHPEGDMLSEIKNLNEMWELERRQWTECEKNWMLTLEEWRVKAEMYRNLSEERKHTVECEQRRTEEMTEALQMAMKGHGYLLDQYAELQEKHLALLAKYRRIREAIGDMKRKAGRAGIKETRWLEAQAAEIMVLKLQQERERKAGVVHLGELQAQLKDTSDAVHAAGELLVRLKETEEAVSIAQKSIAVVEQEAANLKDEMEQLKRKHEVEIRTLQQQLLESRIENRTVYPQYDSVQYVDSNHTANFGDEDKGGDVDLGDKQQLANELDAVHEFRSAFEPFPQDFDSCSSSL